MFFSVITKNCYNYLLLKDGMVLRMNSFNMGIHHLTILVSFLSIQIISFCLTGQVSPLYIITQQTHAEYDLHFAPNDKPLLASKGTKSLNLLPPGLILFIAFFN